jgi:hypothetical protein
MGYITVPTAAKRATWHWPMNTEPTRTELVLHDDPRILAAVGAVVSFSSARCGLTAEQQDALTAAAVAAAKETFPLAAKDETGDPAVTMVITDYPDRVEVEIAHKGEATPSAGLDSFAGNLQAAGGTALNAALQKTVVDRVQYANKDGVQKMTLIKYCAKGAKV